MTDGAAALFRSLRRRSRTGELTKADMARLAENTLVRPDRYGQVLSSAKRQQLREVFRLLAEPLMVTDMSSLKAFSEAATEAVERAVHPSRHPGATLGRKRVIDEDLARSTSALARAALYAEFPKAQDADDLVRRAVTRAQKERQKFRRNTRALPIRERDPLRALFSLPEKGTVRVVPGDLRQRMVDPKSPLTSILRDVSIFSEQRIRQALGEDLWGICRPIGFSDARRSRVLVEVQSSSLAQTAQMRSREILMRLRSLSGFESADELRFRVVSSHQQPSRD